MFGEPNNSRFRGLKRIVPAFEVLASSMVFLTGASYVGWQVGAQVYNWTHETPSHTLVLAYRSYVSRSQILWHATDTDAQRITSRDHYNSSDTTDTAFRESGVADTVFRGLRHERWRFNR